jgi:hypothetical protein
MARCHYATGHIDVFSSVGNASVTSGFRTYGDYLGKMAESDEFGIICVIAAPTA